MRMTIWDPNEDRVSWLDCTVISSTQAQADRDLVRFPRSLVRIDGCPMTFAVP